MQDILQEKDYLKISKEYVRWCGEFTKVEFALKDFSKTALKADGRVMVCIKDLVDYLLFSINVYNYVEKGNLEQGIVTVEELEEVINSEFAYRTNVMARHKNISREGSYYKINLTAKQLSELIKISRNESTYNHLKLSEVNSIKMLRKTLIDIIKNTTVSIEDTNKAVIDGSLIPKIVEEVDATYTFCVDKQIADILSPMTNYNRKYLSDSASLSSVYSKNLHSLLSFALDELKKGVRRNYTLTYIANILGVNYVEGLLTNKSGQTSKSELIQIIKKAINEINNKTRLPKIELELVYNTSLPRNPITNINFIIKGGNGAE